MRVSSNKETLAPGNGVGRRQLVWAASLLLLVGLAGSVVVYATSRVDPDTLWDRARIDFEAKRFSQAEAKLAQLARLREPTTRDLMLRAQVAVANNQIDRALADYDSVPDTDPGAPQARLYQGQLELRRGKLRPAEDAFLRAIRLEPKLVKARQELVFIYGMQLRRRELGEQFMALADLISLDFNDVFTWSLMRNVIWEPTEASDDLARFVYIDPNDRWSRLAYAETLRTLRRPDEAEAVLSALPDSDPDARATRVRLANDRNDEKAAELLLAEGPEDHGELAHLRGRQAFNRRDWPTALRNLRLAYAVDPYDRDILLKLGHTLEMLGQEEEAATFKEAARNQDKLNSFFQSAQAFKSRKIDPTIELLHEMGAKCAAANHLAEARAWYRLALSKDPLDREAQQGLYELNKKSRDESQASSKK